MINKLKDEKVIKDPIHRYIHVQDTLIWSLIQTKEMQRLRRVKQLGMTNLTFPTAEHSRFTHSLGVYEIMRRILGIRENTNGWAITKDTEEYLVALSAALLHDVGHGPFSHTFEAVFDTDHEEYTKKIILDPHTEVNQILSKINADFPMKVAKVIDKSYENQVIVNLISSQIDADRMDYLLRDAYFTGVSYGTFDIERILRVMMPFGNTVVIEEKGMHAVEDHVMSRYQMYMQVYFHPVTRSAEVIVNQIFRRAKALYLKGYQFKHELFLLIPFFERTVSLADYLKLDDDVMRYHFLIWQEEEDSILRDLCSRYMNRKLFKYCDYDPDTDSVFYEKLRQLYQEVGYNPEYYIQIHSSSDLPYDLYRPGKNQRLPITIKQKDNTLMELSECSPIVKAISGKTKTDIKIFYPEDIETKATEKQMIAIKKLISAHKRSKL
ncbi:hypothetical protein BFR38_03645 [Brochothrix thermosphacta]|uniref:HD domain-containing protein n=1 Tax=Brochothrix thermosphacta TaxID=2756 RepID=UPI00083F5CB5|nr:HD domain-containing protein [Brochothrix thermosphacta]ODJ51240.1 hypothetical protein BFR38_03645 [Brochothrix thermosphacta]ODJ59226.1 hypothetical protein BFR42_11935 [Brochothrix thermosphacta]